MAMISDELLQLLRCPRCKGELTRTDAESPGDDDEPAIAAFRCPRCALEFPVEDGIPNFVLEDARPLER